MAANRFDQLIEDWESRIRRAFQDDFYRIRDQIQINRVTDRLAAGDVEGAIRAVGIDPLDFRQFERTLWDAFEAAAVFTALTVPTVITADGFRSRFRFDARNIEAETFLRGHVAGLIGTIVRDQQDMLRQHFSRDLAAGVTPGKSAKTAAGTRDAQTKRRVGGLVGLNARQAEWAQAYADELASDEPNQLRKALERKSRDPRFDAAVKRALESGEPVPAALRDKMYAAYNHRLYRYRSGLLSEMEARTMLHEAQRQALKQAIESGILVPSQLVFKWRSMRDRRVRHGSHASHVYLDGKSARWNEAFVGVSGARIRYPGDPEAIPEETIGCRCWLESIVNLYSADR